MTSLTQRQSTTWYLGQIGPESRRAPALNESKPMRVQVKGFALEGTGFDCNHKHEEIDLM